MKYTLLSLLAMFMLMCAGAQAQAQTVNVLNDLRWSQVPNCENDYHYLSVGDAQCNIASSVPQALITDAPYNAKCDGHSDDTAAIQSAVNAMLTKGNGFGVINLPPSGPGTTFPTTQQCNIVGPVTVPAGDYLTIHGNGSFLGFTGTGHGIEAICTGCFSPIGTVLDIDNLNVDASASSSTSTIIYVDGVTLTLKNISLGNGASGSYAIKAVDGSSILSAGLGADSQILYQQSNGVYSIGDFYAAFNGGPVGSAAITLDDPQGPSTWINTTWLWDCSDGAPNNASNIEFANTLSADSGQYVSIINGTMHSSAGCFQQNFKWDTGANTSVFGNMVQFDGTFPTNVWQGQFRGDLMVASGDLFRIFNGVAVYGLNYSAAGHPIPTCNAFINGVPSSVSDATSPTYLGAYVSGGTVTTRVVCRTTNGSTYSWVTD